MERASSKRGRTDVRSLFVDSTSERRGGRGEGRGEGVRGGGYLCRYLYRLPV